MPARKPQPKAAAPTAAPPAPTVPPGYRVVSGGVSGAGGVPYWHGTIVTANKLGDADRIQQLLDKGSIEVIDDAAHPGPV